MRRAFSLIKSVVLSLTPRFVLSLYHLCWSLLGALMYRFPAHHITVIGVTGTKGKSSVLEMANAIFEEMGYKTALMSTIRIKIGGESRPNMRKMTMPGRTAIQQFLFYAAQDGCDVAFIEITSEGVKQHRHLFLGLNALVFTNLQKEHIESHGSFEKYAEAKLRIGKALVRSRKRPRIMVANTDDPRGNDFLSLPVDVKVPFSLASGEPHSVGEKSVRFVWKGARVEVPMPGKFVLYNAIAAASLADAFNINADTVASAFERMDTIPGRGEKIDAGQPFEVVVDYAHTPDSLRAIYEAYKDKNKICVLGSTGGGRDKWKRPEMGKIAEEYCSHVILTNEDPYDEDPHQIVDQISMGMKNKPETIMNRREAIARAIEVATDGDAVLITGKGTDPFIMGARGSKEPWSDAKVAHAILAQTYHTETSV